MAILTWTFIVTVLQVLSRLNILAPALSWYAFYYMSSVVAGSFYWTLGRLASHRRGAWLLRLAAILDWLFAALGVIGFFFPASISLVLLPQPITSGVFDALNAASILACTLGLVVTGVVPRWISTLRAGSLLFFLAQLGLTVVAYQGAVDEAVAQSWIPILSNLALALSVVFWVMLSLALLKRPADTGFVSGRSTVLQLVVLSIVMLMLLATFPLVVVATAFVFHGFNIDLLINVCVAAFAYIALWRVGASLDVRYRAIADASVADASERPEVPTDLTGTYGLLLICMLPYLIYLFVFSLYGVELLVTEVLVLMDALGGMPFVVLGALVLIVGGSVSGVMIGFWRLFVPAKQAKEYRVPLLRDANRGLWELVDGVAADAGTRTVDRIWVSPDASIGVWEEGGLGTVLRGRATRCMSIGLTAVHDMNVPELKSVLRHEFAHLSNRDTVWGSFTYSLDRSLHEAWKSTPGGNPLKAGSVMGFIVCLNPAWWLYWMFVRLFFRSTAGFSRLREMVADWDAIAYAGGECFAGGLTKVVENGRALDTWLRTAKLENGRVPNVATGVARMLGEMSAEQLLEIRQASIAEVSPDAVYDTHPDTLTRLDYARRAGGGATSCSDMPVSDLFDDWAELDARASELWLVPKKPAEAPPEPQQQTRQEEYDEAFSEAD